MASRIRRWIEFAETVLLVVLLATMIGIAAFQIIARNAFGTGLIWGDDLVQVALLWVTMIGAMAAAGSDGHIRIDVVSRFAGPRLRAVAERLTSLFTAVLCGALGWYSIDFIRWDFLDQTVGFGVVPAWICESVIPVSAWVMAVRYLLRAVWPASDSGGPASGATAPHRGPAG